MKSLVLAPFMDARVVGFIARMNAADLAELGELMREGKVIPVIDRRYSLDEIADAIRYSETGHARGKIVIAIQPADGG